MLFSKPALGGRKGPAVTKPEWDRQFYGFVGKYAFGEFTIDATVSGLQIADGTSVKKSYRKEQQTNEPDDP